MTMRVKKGCCLLDDRGMLVAHAGGEIPDDHPLVERNRGILERVTERPNPIVLTPSPAESSFDSPKLGGEEED